MLTLLEHLSAIGCLIELLCHVLGFPVALLSLLFLLTVDRLWYHNFHIIKMSLEEQELLTLPEDLSSPPDFSGVCVARSLVVCVCFVDRCLTFCTFSFDHCVLRYTDSDYHFGIFKLFLA